MASASQPAISAMPLSGPAAITSDSLMTSTERSRIQSMPLERANTSSGSSGVMNASRTA